MGAETMENLIAALLDGDRDAARKEARALLDEGAGPHDIIAGGVEAAMVRLDAKCTVDQFNLLEIMLAGRAATGVIQEIYPLGDPPPPRKGTVVLGSLEGDVHDLGKNIFKTILTATGYRVVDCGTNCPLEVLVETAACEDALAVGVSGLLTTVMPQVRQVKPRMVDADLGHVKVMVGGGALRQGTAEALNVDFVAQTAFDGLHYLESIIDEEGSLGAKR